MAMGLIDVALPQEYQNGRLLFQQNLDAWREASEVGFENVNFNFQQLALDCFTIDYLYGNDGVQTINPSLLQRIDAIISGDTPIPGTSSPTFVINSGGSSATLSTINLTAPRTYYFPDASGTFALLESNQTFTGDNIFDGTVTINDVTSIVSATLIGNAFSVTADSLTTGKVALFTSNSADVSARNIVEIVNDNAAAVGATTLFINQDADAIALNIDAENLTTNVFDLQADALTTGGIVRFYSNSADVSARTLLTLHNDNAAAVGVGMLSIQQDSTGIVGTITAGTTVGQVLEITADALTTGGASGTGILYAHSNSASNAVRTLMWVRNVNAAATGTLVANFQNASTGQTVLMTGSGNVLQLDGGSTTDNILLVEGSSLTTGTLARFYSNSADVSVRNLVEIVNDAAGATGANCLFIQQDSDDECIIVNANGNSAGDLTVTSSATSGSALLINSDSLTTGYIAQFASNSADVSARSLIFIHNNNNAATGTVCLEIRQDSSGNCVEINPGGGSPAEFIVNSNAELLLPNVDPPTANYMNRHSSVKAYVFFTTDGAGASTIQSSYNVASITDDLANDFYQIFLDTNMSSANYVVVGNATGNASQSYFMVPHTLAADSFQVIAYDTNGSSLQNNLSFYAVVYGTQA